MTEDFRWGEHCASLCNAPLKLLKREDLDPRHPAIEFDNYWSNLKGGEIPAKEDFSPVHVKTVLKWMMLFERQMKDSEDLYKLYLQGTSAAELTNGSLQGQYLHEFTNADCYNSRRDLMRYVLKEGKPGFATAHTAPLKTDSEYSTDVTVGMFPFRNIEGECQVFVVPAPVSEKIRGWLNASW
ncbi:PAS domain-containing protein [Kordiimonas laminariae]|uniref:PAS domain-containing protein n=1 Tax=Kordiimonas laminariae TaxID=2917717 RepID=UPI001FF276BD|nr:PAS domain-containing protein [Kordiimonas laminariae]MCK0069512.1 PAS domain-containing protein [Kordiimonas laminariae]